MCLSGVLLRTIKYRVLLLFMIQFGTETNFRQNYESNIFSHTVYILDCDAVSRSLELAPCVFEAGRACYVVPSVVLHLCSDSATFC